MSEESKVPEVVGEQPTTDIVGKDAADLQLYMEKGMPGIGSIEEVDVKKMFDLYLSGKTYRQISGIMRAPKVAVMCLSHKLGWLQKRQEYITDLEANNRTRIHEATLMSQDFLLQLIQMWHKKIGAKMNRYMTTDNEEFVNQINLKELDRYLKALDLLQKSIAVPKDKGPLIGLNLGDGATVTRTGENTIEVTPKQKANENMLKELANMRRAEDKK